ncbi:MAG TPA: hypothetical protein ENN84_01360 [Candidatus Marinimicrobia bacterium]|nr:hypothetical protein [Candidatus Neomarinimicrobiota bacterium]
MNRINILIFISLLIFSGCANHPTIMPGKLEPGKSSYCYTFSAENIVPVYTWSYGINSYLDGAVHIGLPIWGTGASLSYLTHLDSTENAIRFRKVNLGYTWQHNAGFDLTLLRERYIFKHSRYIYTGMRATYIPKGISGSNAFRLGILLGSWWNERIGVELGYTYDFALGTNWVDPVQKWPTEHHPMTGLSFRLSFGKFITPGTNGE